MNQLINSIRFKNFLTDITILAGLAILIKTGQVKPYLNKSQAFRRYGRRFVEEALNLGLLVPRKDGGHSAIWRIDRIEVECLMLAKKYLDLFQPIQPIYENPSKFD